MRVIPGMIVVAPCDYEEAKVKLNKPFTEEEMKQVVEGKK